MGGVNFIFAVLVTMPYAILILWLTVLAMELMR